MSRLEMGRSVRVRFTCHVLGPALKRNRASGMSFVFVLGSHTGKPYSAKCEDRSCSHVFLTGPLFKEGCSFGGEGGYSSFREVYKFGFQNNGLS